MKIFNPFSCKHKNSIRRFRNDEIFLECLDCNLRSEGWMIEKKDLAFKRLVKKVRADNIRKFKKVAKG